MLISLQNVSYRVGITHLEPDFHIGWWRELQWSNVRSAAEPVAAVRESVSVFVPQGDLRQLLFVVTKKKVD